MSTCPILCCLKKYHGTYGLIKTQVTSIPCYPLYYSFLLNQ
uniref:Uncharacterized protein n=1 Tax=Vibrio tasmaniensis TaxID=212663 RepID=A0A0H3ZTF9_9VIBR|nr:hypothetical protein [Vibrio tasmaniensis]